MKSFLKATLQLSMWLLILQVMKVVVEKAQFRHATLLSTAFTCVQVVVFLGYLLFPLYNKVAGKYPTVQKHRYLIGSLFFLLALIPLEALSVYLLRHPSAIPGLFQQSFANYYQEFDRTIITFDKKKARYDRGLFYMLKPDTTLAFGNIEFNTTVCTNAKGLRDDNASLVNPDIICLGDSYTFGWGVDDRLLFADKLEAQTGLKVLNAGVSSFGTAREVILLNQLDTANLQYLVIQYCDNDEQENTSYVTNNYRLDISSEETYDHTGSILDDKIKYFPGKVFLLTTGDFFTQPFQQVKKVVKSRLRKKEKEVKTFLEVLRHSNINFSKVKVIVTYVAPFDILTNPFMTELKKVKQESPYKELFGNNLVVLDLSQRLCRQDYFTLDIHLKASGHEKIASALAEAIAKNRE